MTGRYDRDFVHGTSGKYAKILQHLDRARVLLEVGCHTGSFSAYLQGRGFTVIGVESDPEAAGLAEEKGVKVVRGDIEVPAVLMSIDEQFDAVLLMDVLEHLVDPGTVLRRLKEKLRPGGRVLVTGPNVAYWAIRKDLLLGQFRYADGGIMDRTHLRFYTSETWQELLEGAGYRIVSIESAEGMIPLESRLPRFWVSAKTIEKLRNNLMTWAPTVFTTVYLVEATPA